MKRRLYFLIFLRISDVPLYRDRIRREDANNGTLLPHIYYKNNIGIPAFALLHFLVLVLHHYN